MYPNRMIGLITDFGTANRFTGIMKGVAYGIDPELKIIDICRKIYFVSLSSNIVIVAVNVHLLKKRKSIFRRF